MSDKPNVLFIMTDQQRFDTIAALGNRLIYTPSMDRLARRGAAFTNAYSTCPVCVPARYTIRTGCGPARTGFFQNGSPRLSGDQPESMRDRCGPYLAERMSGLGYRTFGTGKFHSLPWDEDLGYEVHRHSEETYGKGQRERDAYAAWIASEHPALDYQEGLMGERTEMYYMPQRSDQPALATVEHWVAQEAIGQIDADDGRPFFGFVSFIGPHPPFAPPIPFNRMYHPDRMGEPEPSDVALDHLDQMIPWMNHTIWAEDINLPWYRIAKARYYGEISYIDWCLGLILDAVERREDADNTVICFFSDHGDHLGDHHGWQKESFFEQSCHVPFLLSWPGQIPSNVIRNDLVCLTDLYGIATSAAAAAEMRDGADVLGAVTNQTETRRDFLVGCHGEPGTRFFKTMIRRGAMKYIFLANGGHELLFDLNNDPGERTNLAQRDPEATTALRRIAIDSLSIGASAPAIENGDLREFAYETYGPGNNPAGLESDRIYQFDTSRGVTGFPDDPAHLYNEFSARHPSS